MPNALVKTGKTVEEALAAALAELNATAADVDYKVIEEPGKKLFGLLGLRPAKIEVTLKAPREDVAPQAVPDGAVVASSSAESIADEEEPTADAPSADAAPDNADKDGQVSAKDVTTPKRRIAMDKAEAFLVDVFAAMNVTVNIERCEKGDTVTFNLTGERMGVLIGKRGQTVDSLQYLVNLAVNRDDPESRIRVIVDVENYRCRREETLRALALRLADRARYLHEEVKLEPMNRHDRKIIHMTLAGDRRVMTYSDGEDPYRHVVIAPRRKGKGVSRRPFSHWDKE